MSLITSVKCARFRLTHSYLSLLANYLILVLASSFVILSDLPLVAVFPSIYLLMTVTIKSGFFASALLGDVTFLSAQEYQLDRSLIPIKRVVFALSPAALLIVHDDNSRVLLWRDSMSEKQYRDLIVMLKREH
ncbi:protein YgfX [Vibrio ouci]|nr:protein YgfX [Vibrio ouci]